MQTLGMRRMHLGMCGIRVSGSTNAERDDISSLRRDGDRLSV